MKSFLKIFAAAAVGIALFAGGLIGWVNLVGNGDGIGDSGSASDEAYLDSLISDRLSTLDILGNGASSSSDTGASRDESSADGLASQSVPAESASAMDGAGTEASSAASGASSAGAASSASGASSASSSGTSSATGASAGSTSGTSSSGASSSSSDGNFDGAVSKDEASEPYASYMEKIETELTPDYAGHFTVEYLNGDIIISVWQNGLTDRLTDALSTGSVDTVWNSMKVALSDISTTYYNGLTDEFPDTCDIRAHLLDENDKDKIILAYTNGVLSHDGLRYE